METKAIARVICNELFYPDNRWLNQEFNELHSLNVAAGKASGGFLVNGKFFGTLPEAPKQQRYGRPVKRPDTPIDMQSFLIDPALHERAHAYKAADERIRTDHRLIEQGLITALAPCRTPQDIRDSLPDLLTIVLPVELRALPRTRLVMWLTEGQPFRAVQLEQLHRRMETYVIKRMLV